MAISSTNYADLAYVVESVAGQTPTTPSFSRLPVTSIDISDSITTTVSEVIRFDRQTDDLVVTDAEVGGECNYELSYGPFKPLLTSLMQSTATTVAVVAANDIVFSNTNGEITSTTTNFTSEGVVAGQYLRFSGAVTNATNNGVYKIVSVTDANTLVVSPSPAVDGSEASINIDGTNIRNGYAAPDSYTFRKKLNAPSGSTSIFYYRGCQVSSASMEFATGSILNGTLGVMGLTSEGTATPISGETITDPPAYDIMNAVSSVADIEVQGLPAGTEFSTMSLTIDNQINSAKAIGTLGAADLASFSLSVTADMEIYFQDTSIYNIYKNSSSFSVTVHLQDNSGNDLIVYMPKCKFEELSEPVEGKDNFLMESGSFRALRDDTTDMMIQFTFIDA